MFWMELPSSSFFKTLKVLEGKGLFFHDSGKRSDGDADGVLSLLFSSSPSLSLSRLMEFLERRFLRVFVHVSFHSGLLMWLG